jgi:hypothetical protein
MSLGNRCSARARQNTPAEQGGRCENVWLVVWLCVVPFTVDFVMFVYMWLCEYL